MKTLSRAIALFATLALASATCMDVRSRACTEPCPPCLKGSCGCPPGCEAVNSCGCCRPKRNSSDSTSVTLNNGIVMPSISFGLQVYDDDTAEKLTKLAISAGFRNIFTSVLAGNQQGVGQGLKAASVARSDLFICGSVNSGSCTGANDCYSSTKQAAAQNLVDLQLQFLDMIMLDYPAADCESIKGQWKSFKEMYANNKTRSIAVSNFSPDQLDCLLNETSRVIPAVNQMPYSVGHGSDSVTTDDPKRNVVVQAYSPLQSGSLIHDPDCVAIGKHHNKTAAQVALKWILQRNVTICTESQTLEHFKEDLALFDFELTEAEMATLNKKSIG